MELLGIGAWELIAILLVMLLVAGPKRMIAWSYKLGQYVAVMRKMWGETAQMLQKELDDAGVNIKVPTEPPTRGSIQKEISRAIAPVTKPITDSLDEVKKDMGDVKASTSMGSWSRTAANKTPAPTPEKPAETAAQNGQSSQNGQANFGTWSSPSGDETGSS
jgi:Sec-independent protein translocase protein TatA